MSIARWCSATSSWRRFAKYSQHPEVAKVVERFRTRERRKAAHAVSTGERRMMLIAHQGDSSEEDSRLRTKEIPA